MIGTKRLVAAASRPTAAAIVLLASTLWSTTVMIVLVASIFSEGGSVAAALMVLGYVFPSGPVLGLIAGGAHILVSFLLGRVFPRLVRDVLAALLGWAAALTAWLAVGSGGLDERTVAGSFAAAAIGSVIIFIVVRSPLGRV